MEEEYKYIIIGGGIAGLHMGALLSQHGKTLILEKSKEIGGRAKVIDIKGFRLDYGPHPIRYGPNSALAKSLMELGKPVEFLKPGKSWAFLKNGIKTIFPTGGLLPIIQSKMVPTLATIKLILWLKKMKDADLFSLFDISLKEWYKKESIHPEIQKFLTMVSSSVQVNPFIERSSVGELIYSIKKALELGSAFVPKEGWIDIFNRFTSVIKENKGHLRLDSEVQKILIKDSKAIGVRVGNEEIMGEIIVNTIPVQSLFSILDENSCDKRFVSKCKNLRPTAGISIDFCLSHPVSNIRGFIFFDEPLSFGYIPSNLTENLTPPGKSLMCFLTIANVEDIKDKNKMKEIHLILRKRILKEFPQIEDNLEHERLMVYEMVDGVEINTEQHRLKRPGNEVPSIKNLYITGDSVGGEGAGGDVGHTSVRGCYSRIRTS